MKRFNSAIFTIAILFLTTFAVSAQETELKVVDEVVAQVNDNVVTLSGIKREMRETIAALKEAGKSQEEAEKEVNGKQAELIANIINEELLMQKGKELGVEAEVDAEINNRLRQKMQELNIKSVDKLYEMMRSANIDPDDIREMWRKQLTRDFVLQKEVDGKLYYSWTSKEIKDYYEKNKAKYNVLEKRKAKYIYLDTVKQRQFVTVSDDELRQYYSQHQNEYNLPARVGATLSKNGHGVTIVSTSDYGRCMVQDGWERRRTILLSELQPGTEQRGRKLGDWGGARRH